MVERICSILNLQQLPEKHYGNIEKRGFPVFMVLCELGPEPVVALSWLANKANSG